MYIWVTWDVITAESDSLGLRWSPRCSIPNDVFRRQLYQYHLRACQKCSILDPNPDPRIRDLRVNKLLGRFKRTSSMKRGCSGMQQCSHCRNPELLVSIHGQHLHWDSARSLPGTQAGSLRPIWIFHAFSFQANLMTHHCSLLLPFLPRWAS